MLKELSKTASLEKGFSVPADKPDPEGDDVSNEESWDSDSECVTFDLLEHVNKNKRNFDAEFQKILEEAEKKKLEKDRTLIPSSFQRLISKYLEDPAALFYEEIQRTSATEFIRHLQSINYEGESQSAKGHEVMHKKFKSEVKRKLIKWVKIDIFSSDEHFKKTKLEKAVFNTNLRKVAPGKLPKNLPIGLEHILEYLDYSFYGSGLFHLTRGFLGNQQISNPSVIHDNFFLYVKVSDIKYTQKPAKDMNAAEIKEMVGESATNPRSRRRRRRPTATSGRRTSRGPSGSTPRPRTKSRT